MRPSEHASRSEEGGYEHVARGRASPDPSLSDSYYDDEDDEPEEEDDMRQAGSHTEDPAPGPASASTSAVQAPPQKPKRTRQLTTPHQSAVLHALLAQSRFPTTAMREEVGRQIGLSARKVQVWFQNQRQKARKGSKDAAAASMQRTGPPQFEPYSSVPAGPSHGPPILPNPSFVGGPSGARFRMSRGSAVEPSTSTGYPGPAPGPVLPPIMTSIERTGRRGSGDALEPYPLPPPPGSALYSSSGTSTSGTRLTGPGVPGASVGADPFSQPRRASPLPPLYTCPMTPGSSLRLPPMHTISPPLRSIIHQEGQARAEAAVYGSERLERDLPAQSMRLPPLQIDPDSYQRGLGLRSSSRSSLGLSAYSPTLPRPRPLPLSRIAAGASPASTIPPPFTLEPSPVWSSSSASSSARRPASHSALVAGPSSRAEIRLATESGESESSLLERRTLPAPAGMARFDPVRDPDMTVPADRQPLTMHSRFSDDEDLLSTIQQKKHHGQDMKKK